MLLKRSCDHGCAGCMPRPTLHMKGKWTHGSTMEIPQPHQDRVPDPHPRTHRLCRSSPSVWRRVCGDSRHAAFGGLSSLASYLNIGSMSCTMNEVQIAVGLGLLLGVILVGKLFCSYLCPIGSVTNGSACSGEKLKIRREIPAKVDRPLRALKYVLLFLTIYFTMTSSELFCKEFEPYFAVANLFKNTDINLLYAILATVITVGGHSAIVCSRASALPLGALSNIFLNAVPVAVLIGAFVVANLLGCGDRVCLASGRDRPRRRPHGSGQAP